MVEETDTQFRPAWADPMTHAPLQRDGSRLRPESDDRSFLIQHEVPNFLRYPRREPETTQDRLRLVIAKARDRDWREAVHEVYGDGEKARYITDEARTQFLSLVPLNEDTDALEIGCSMGQHTAALARRVRRLHALEVVPEQAEFTQERCRQEGVSNLAVAAGGDDCRLPYLASSFDSVILNLVFEWCGSRIPDEDAASAQQRLLAEACRVLRPGGTLFLSTKNRFALRLLAAR